MLIYKHITTQRRLPRPRPNLTMKNSSNSSVKDSKTSTSSRSTLRPRQAPELAEPGTIESRMARTSSTGFRVVALNSLTQLSLTTLPSETTATHHLSMAAAFSLPPKAPNGSTALTHDLTKKITPSLAQLVSVHMISVKDRSATAGSCTVWLLSQRSPAESRESSSTMNSAQMESTESSFTSSESQPLLSLMTVFHSALQEARSSARSVQMVPSGESFLRKPSQRLSEHTRR